MSDLSAPTHDTDPGQGGGERRNEARFRVHWHVAASLDGRRWYQGFLKDISIEGATLYLDHNLEHHRAITLQIQVPPLAAHAPAHLIGIDCHSVYSIHDNSEQMFRTGVMFTKFHQEADRDFLETRLLKFEIPAP